MSARVASCARSQKRSAADLAVFSALTWIGALCIGTGGVDGRFVASGVVFSGVLCGLAGLGVPEAIKELRNTPLLLLAAGAALVGLAWGTLTWIGASFGYELLLVPSNGLRCGNTPELASQSVIIPITVMQTMLFWIPYACRVSLGRALWPLALWIPVPALLMRYFYEGVVTDYLYRDAAPSSPVLTFPLWAPVLSVGLTLVFLLLLPRRSSTSNDS